MGTDTTPLPGLAGIALGKHLRDEPHTTQCTYCGEPSTTIRTGRQGNTFGLCADCNRDHIALIAGPIIAQLEVDRQKMRDAGQSTPNYEVFVNLLVAIIRETADPRGALRRVYHLLAQDRADRVAIGA